MSVCTSEQRTARDNLTAPGKPGAFVNLLIVYVPLVTPRFSTTSTVVETGFFLARPGTDRQTPWAEHWLVL